VRRPGPNRERIEIGASVRFPVSSIPLMQEALQALVEKQAIPGPAAS
jgi:hypothetical protein